MRVVVLFFVFPALIAIGAEMPTTRIPTASDIPAVLELTRENRTLLAELEPDGRRKSAKADESHRAFVTAACGSLDYSFPNTPLNLPRS